MDRLGVDCNILVSGICDSLPVKNVLLLGHFRIKKQKKAIQKKKRLQKVQNVMFSIVSEKKKEKHKFHKYCVKVPKAKKKIGNVQQYECYILNFTTNINISR